MIDSPSAGAAAGSDDTSRWVALLLAALFGVPTQLVPLAALLPVCLLRHDRLARAARSRVAERAGGPQDPTVAP